LIFLLLRFAPHYIRSRPLLTSSPDRPLLSSPSVTLVTTVKTPTLLLLASLLAACHHDAPRSGPVRHYPLSGKVVALDPAHQTATIDAAAIPNYMEAMTMEYPVQSKSEFALLRVGAQIRASVDVASDDTYVLSQIKPQSAGK
jgi:Cu/Ag efflux protein CusF